MNADRNLRASVFLIMVLGVAVAAWNIKAAQTSTCSDKQAEQALNLPDHYQSWDQAYRIFRQFSGCDDGAIGEGFSEAIAQLLIRDWAHLDSAVRLTSSDRRFKDFVLKHIDATLSDDELHLIIRDSRSRCPVKDKQLCKGIEKSALASLDEQKEN